ncbi:MAG: SDR family NAD(P)-dependent oxidoreductase [Candidatus Omnitrophica bacterium]|nr:SDR family NAD(P)-dependent oxidoreductase [Candidatus Omnitrophota bacterium]
MEVSLQNKIILITGGTGGLGQSLVHTFDREKARVIFTFFTHEDRARELEQLGACGFHVDLSDRNSVKQFIERLKKEIPRLDGIIHNAGISRDHTMAKFEESELDESLEVNLTSVFRMSVDLLSLLEKSSLPKIINVVSRTGLCGNFGQAAYAATKAGLIALTKTMAAEWGAGENKILVNAMTPGYLMSDMTHDLPEEIHEKARKESYLGVISDSDEVAEFAAYLMSDHVKKISGQIFHYDTRR